MGSIEYWRRNDKSESNSYVRGVYCVAFTALSEDKPLLELMGSTPLPQLHDGDFDHFALDEGGSRLFSTAEENSQVLVFDLKTNRLVHSITDLKAPHSMLFRADLKKKVTSETLP